MKKKIFFKFLIGLFILTVSSCDNNNLDDYEEGYISGSFLCDKVVNGHPTDTLRGFCILLVNRENSKVTYYPMDIYTFSLPDGSITFPPEILNMKYDGANCGPMFFPDSLIPKYKFLFRFRNSSENEKNEFVCGPCFTMEAGFPWYNYKQVTITECIVNPL